MNCKIIKTTEEPTPKYPYFARGKHHPFQERLFYIIGPGKGIEFGFTAVSDSIQEDNLAPLVGKFTLEVF